MEQHAESRRMLADSEIQPPRETKPLRVEPTKNKPKQKWFSRGLIYTGLIVLTIICFIPFLMMLVNATRTNGEIMTGFSLIPGTALLDNYTILSDYINIWIGLKNSLIIAVLVTLLSGYFSAMTAFGFAFYNFKGKT